MKARTVVYVYVKQISTAVMAVAMNVLFLAGITAAGVREPFDLLAAFVGGVVIGYVAFLHIIRLERRA